MEDWLAKVVCQIWRKKKKKFNCSLFDVSDLGLIVRAKLEFRGIGCWVWPNSVELTPDIPNLMVEVLDELQWWISYVKNCVVELTSPSHTAY